MRKVKKRKLMPNWFKLEIAFFFLMNIKTYKDNLYLELIYMSSEIILVHKCLLIKLLRFRACDFCDLPTNDSRINSREDKCQCVISDGFEKTVLSINRTIPGPSIQVCIRFGMIISM